MKALALAALLIIQPTGMLNEIDGPADSTPAPAVRLNPPAPQPPLADDRTVEQMIRDVWPDQLEQRALRIAYRESRYQPRVHTSCCFGVFEIHKMHLSWLCAEIGVCTIEDLFDPLLNVRAAYRLYQRDGWAPWSLG